MFEVVRLTLYTAPKPPCPSLFSSAKFAVALLNVVRSKRSDRESSSSSASANNRGVN